jgi:O-antigen ligase
MPRRQHAAGLLEMAAIIATLAAILALLHARALADGLICTVDLLFLVRCALLRDWAWTGRAWVILAGAFCLWLLLCTLRAGDPHAIGEALVVFRLPLFAAALQDWVLRRPSARLGLMVSFIAAALWIGGQTWLQFLTGHNLFGDQRWSDGALTGPFFKPRAGMTLLAVFFPAILPSVLRILDYTTVPRRLAGLLLLVVAVATMVLIGQRMPVLLVGFGLLIAALFVRRLRKPVAIALLGGGLLLALTPIVSPATFDKLAVHFVQQMSHFWDSPYGQIYLRALAMIREAPVFGLGLDGFRTHCADPHFFKGSIWLGVSDARILAADGCNIHPHNYWLDVTVSGGLVGLAMFAGLAVLWLRRISRNLVPDIEPMRFAVLIATVVALWPIASTSSLFVADTGGWIVLTIGWGLALADAAATAEPCPGSASPADRDHPTHPDLSSPSNTLP